MSNKPFVNVPQGWVNAAYGNPARGDCAIKRDKPSESAGEIGKLTPAGECVALIETYAEVVSYPPGAVPTFNDGIWYRFQNMESINGGTFWVRARDVEFTPLEMTRKTNIVPYVSQNGPGSSFSANDCGPACAVMLLGANAARTPDVAAPRLTVDAFYKLAGIESRGYTLVTELMRGIQAASVMFGQKLQPRFIRPLRMAQLFRLLQEGVPVMMLVNYAFLNDAGKSFPHYVVVNGFHYQTDSKLGPLTAPAKKAMFDSDADARVRLTYYGPLQIQIHDPLNKYNGVIPADKFARAIGETAPANLPYQGLYIQPSSDLPAVE